MSAMNEALPPPPKAPSNPPPAAEARPQEKLPGWKQAVFNYGTLVAVVLGVLGMLFAQLADLRVAARGHDERFAAVGQRFDAVEQRFDAVDKRLERIEARLDKMDERFERVVTALRALEVGQARIEEKLDKRK